MTALLRSQILRILLLHKFPKPSQLEHTCRRLERALEPLGNTDPRDGDCLDTSAQLCQAFRATGLEPELATVFAWSGENVLGWGHRVVRISLATDALVVDGTARLLNPDLPAVLVTPVASYERLLQAKGYLRVTWPNGNEKR